MNKLLFASIAALLPARALASECVSDNQCPSGWCMTYTIPGEPCPWWNPLCVPEDYVGGECADDVVQLENEYSGECMRPENGSSTAGAEVVLDTCAATASRDWGLFRLDDGTTMIVNAWSELCLTNSGSDYFQEACNFLTPPNSQQYVETLETNDSHRLFQNAIGPDCVRGTTTGGHYIFESHNCDLYNNSSRHWFYN